MGLIIDGILCLSELHSAMYVKTVMNFESKKVEMIMGKQAEK
jgi:hypothetical protein